LEEILNDRIVLKRKRIDLLVEKNQQKHTLQERHIELLEQRLLLDREKFVYKQQMQAAQMQLERDRIAVESDKLKLALEEMAIQKIHGTMMLSMLQQIQRESEKVRKSG
jgi:hypothetical protein